MTKSTSKLQYKCVFLWLDVYKLVLVSLNNFIASYIVNKSFLVASIISIVNRHNKRARKPSPFRNKIYPAKSIVSLSKLIVKHLCVKIYIKIKLIFKINVQMEFQFALTPRINHQ